MEQVKKYQLGLFFIFSFIAAYLFFMPYETPVVYGDDLFLFNDHYSLSKFSDQVNILIPYSKYRPVHGVVFNLVIDLFQKNTHYYFLFNIFIQAINITIFAAILNLFLDSFIFSLLFGLVFGLSRFFYFYVTQLLNGGPSEGLGLIFFLLVVYLTLKPIVADDATPSKKYRYLLWAILVANLNIYTLEKYIIVFPHIVLVVLFFQHHLKLSMKQRGILCTLAILSPVLNFAIKKYAFSMPFFMGTGGAVMQFSLDQALGFLKDAIVSVCQVNTGPEYLVGIQFGALPVFDKVLVCTIVFFTIVAIQFSLFKVYLMFSQPGTGTGTNIIKRVLTARKLPILLLLVILFFLTLIPAVATIRLEHRWLTAPLGIFVLMLVIVLGKIKYRSATVKYVIYSLVAFSFLWINHTYLAMGMTNSYMYFSEQRAITFKQGLDNNTIHHNTEKLYLWEKKRDINIENGDIWILDGGEFFKFYGAKQKQLIFVDSLYTKTDTSYTTSFPGFDTANAQIVFWGDNKLIEITKEYQKDSLKAFLSTVN